ncbi:hypothetical protein SAMN02983004_00896 [Borreliella japonica]|uniref:Uncharacterized protein n=1 Tax=Borreliella japonica TaxID=34095 RepID=A0A1G4Q2Q2_BORJA|nr:hypothetical protein [Borreliella japonica]WKC88612.1 hypothetical protein QIA20_00475 [Borreliella japonica]WKC88633.1 hypothetical protein QIA20_00585 [Borreliella japonica]SCW38836.1 hypothetical protein SAMN02983004_00896 [Borreliella japonica]
MRIINAYSYNLQDDEEIAVKLLYEEAKIIGNSTEDHSVSSVETLILIIRSCSQV